MSLAITGASGTFGRLAAKRLLESVDSSEVVLLSRDPAKLADFAERGAETRRADFSDPASLAGAFAGVERLLLISTDIIGDRVAGHLAAIDAAVTAGVRHIAYTSITDPSDSNPAAVAAEHRETEDHLRASGAAWTFLRNSIYAEMLAGPAQGALASGTLVTNAGGGATSYVARADCAAAAVAVIATVGHEGRIYDVTGPEALDAEAQAALFSAVGGKDVAVAHVDDDAWVAGMVEQAGLPRPPHRTYATFGIAARARLRRTPCPQRSRISRPAADAGRVLCSRRSWRG